MNVLKLIDNEMKVFEGEGNIIPTTLLSSELMKAFALRCGNKVESKTEIETLERTILNIKIHLKGDCECGYCKWLMNQLKKELKEIKKGKT